MIKQTTPPTFTCSEFISFFSTDQALTPTPGLEDIADANRTFTVMLHWGIFKEISPGLYEIVPELVREFPLRVFERFSLRRVKGLERVGGRSGVVGGCDVIRGR
jgi:hypothetical protein